MMRIAAAAFCVLMTLLASTAALAREAVEVRHWVDRTALFPGDRITYHIEIRCTPNVDILAEDLDAEQLNLSGLEVISSARDRTISNAGITYHVQYRLTTYEVGATSLLIGEQDLRYYRRRPGQRVEEAVPAGEVTVPATTLALRSTLPGDSVELSDLPIRDGRTSATVPGTVIWAGAVGGVLAALSVLPVALWAAPLIHRRITAVRQRRIRQEQRRSRDILDGLQSVDPSSPPARRTGFDQLQEALRTLLGEVGDVPAGSLTPAEIAVRLAPAALPVPVEDLVAVLEDCEQARYGRDEPLPPADRFKAGVAVVRVLLARD